jgi:choline-sulfatase
MAPGFSPGAFFCARLEWREMARRRKRAAEPAPIPIPLPAARGSGGGSGGSVLRIGLAAAGVALLGFAAWRLAARPARPNLLLITLDTLRADRLGSYGYAQAETPALDALGARGVRFEHAQSPIPLTGPSHSTILTGLYPPVHGVRDNVVFTLDDRHETLAERLKKEGYRTGAFVGAYPVAAAFGFRQGFDEFKEGFKENAEGAGAQRPANEVADDAIAFVSARQDAPFFAWAHFYDPHAPYEPPEPYKTRFAGREYDGEVAFTDAQVGRVLDALRAAGHGEDTVVAVVADHGESLGEHGEVTHAVLIYESTLHVPFLLAGPALPKGLIVKSRVGLVDLLPTLLGLLDREAKDELPGRDLRPAFRGERLAAETLYAESLFGRLNCRWSSLRAVTEGDLKLIEGARPELFDLAADPAETHNLADSRPDAVGRLRGLLRAALGQMVPGGDKARAAAVSPDQEALLRSLGYLSGSGGRGELDEPGLPDPRDRVALYEQLQVLQRPQKIGHEQALVEAVAISEQDPGNPFGHQTVASLAYRIGRLGVAARAYRHALELDPERPMVRQNFGKLLRELGRLEESEKELRLAVEQTGADDLRTRASLVETLVLAGKLDEAGKLADGLFARGPKDPDVLRARGRWLIATGRIEEAAQAMNEAAVATDADPLAELAAAWIGKGEGAKAQAAAEAALQRTPGQPWATGLLGHALVLQGRREAGVLALRKAMQTRPKRPQAWLSLAAGFAAARDEASAAACRRAARELQSS